MKLQFKLSRLMWATLLVAIVVLGYTRWSYHRAVIEIVSTQLKVAGDGTLSGDFVWCFTEDSEPPPSRFPPYVVCHVANMPPSQLQQLNKGDRFKITFRRTAVFPFPADDPYEIFHHNVLGIDVASIQEGATLGDVVIYQLQPPQPSSWAQTGN